MAPTHHQAQPVSKAALAAEFGVDDLSDITGDGDDLYAEYLRYEADLEADRIEQDTAHFHGGRDDY